MKKLMRLYSRSALALLLFLFSGSFLMAQKNVKILAIRVEFQEDNNRLTTGNGRFDLRSVSPDSIMILPDPSPHNKMYFEDHLLFLKNYYEKVSRGHLEVDYDCFPENAEQSYQLPHEMAYYNPNTSPGDIDKGLAELFRDAWTAAAEDPAIDFSSYNCFFIFHAGVGRDINQGFDETPQDIASLYVTPEFLQKNLGINGVSIGNGIVISQGAILPETETQGDYQLAMNGIVVANFGTYLGLPDMFNSKTGRPGVGIFDVMDVGLFNAQGFLPSIPMAWHRIQQGWVEPVTITGISDTLLTIGNVISEEYPSVYKFPVSSDEYFLVEFRNPGLVSFDSAAFLDSFKLNAKQTLLKHFSNMVTFSPRGVLTDVSNPDLSMPTNGALIWHVDENVIHQRMRAGEDINNDSRHKGVDLEEADGSQDIGEEFSGFGGGSGSENGYIWDMFYDGNRAPVFIENGNMFSPHTLPSSNSYYLQAVSGIRLENFLGSDSLMTFRAHHELFATHFPFDTPVRDAGKFLQSPHFSAMDDEQLFIYNSNQVYRLETTGSVTTQAEFASTDSIVTLYPGLPGSQSLLVQTAHGLHLMNYSGSDWTDVDSVNVSRIWKHPLTVLMQDSSAMLWGITPAGFLETWELVPNEIRNYSSVFDGMDKEDKIIPVQYGGEMNLALISPDGSLKIVDVIRETVLMTYQELPVTDGWWIVSADKAEATFYFATESGVMLEFKPGEDSPRLLSDLKDANLFFTPLQWNNYGKWMTAFAFPSADLKLINAGGSTFLHFPAMYESENESVHYDKIFPVVREITGAADGAIYLPVLSTESKRLNNHTDEIHSKILTLYSQDGKINSQYMLPLGNRSDVFHFEARHNSFRLYAIDSSGVLSAFDFPFSPVQMSAYVNSSQYNLHLMQLENLTDSGQPAFLKGLMPENLVYNWPNPVKTGVTHIRFFLTEDAKVSIHVFSTSGMKVWSQTINAKGHMDTDVEWDVSKIPSGVYLAKISAKSGNKNEEKIIKIAVVH